MRKWLRETHGVQFELIRHFLRRLLESEMITDRQQTVSALIGGVSLLLPWFQVLYGPLKAKYGYLSHLPVPGPYREAVRADELWLITLMMSIVGLLTAFKWQALFPDMRDYRVLGTLPLRHRQIFAAKLLALFIAAAAVLVGVNWIPSAAFPMLSKSHWAFPVRPSARIGAYALASTTAGAFSFFGLVALQGVLLNVLRPRVFRRITGYLQGLLVGAMLSLIVLSFSIQPQVVQTLLQSGWVRAIPPIWFLGLCQSRSGDPDLVMHAFADQGVTGLLAAMLLTLLTYAVSYRRHRTLMTEGATGRPNQRRPSAFFGWLFPDPRQQGVVDFMIQTLTRSSHHRMILMGYGAVAFALTLSGISGLGSLVDRERLTAASFVYFHIVTVLLLLIGTRHLFSLPTELKANWMFQITECGADGQWLRAVDRFVFFWSVILWAMPLPLEIRWLGWRGISEAALSLMMGLPLYDCLFLSWNKLPFTCSYLPGKTPGWILALQGFAVIALVPVLQTALLATLYSALGSALTLCALSIVWLRVHALRQEGWSGLRLKFDEVPEPVVNGLRLLR
jgi:hypothetical protein